jgi:hypothetical protein
LREDNRLPVLSHLLNKSIRFIDGVLHRVNESGDIAIHVAKFTL